jgi:hypothetical protein
MPALIHHEDYGRWFREGESVIPDLWSDISDDD